ncbi:hypothetical protein K502DRAFT_343420 [Neoconidiobolus thromboides FSU 785]|nr:hypothetical protein K502DRAFT_343420 [Neoconidiobolus thromboides FSU 785]
MEIKNSIQDIYRESSHMSLSENNEDYSLNQESNGNSSINYTEDKETSTSNKPSKKPGRKIDDSEPVSKRLAQNRAAQKAFRERRENFVRSLQEKVKALEEANKLTQEENNTLLNSIKILEQANQQLKTSNNNTTQEFNPNLASQPFPSLNNGFNSGFNMFNYDTAAPFQQNFSPDLNYLIPNNPALTTTSINNNPINVATNLSPLIDPNMIYNLPVNNENLMAGDEYLFPEFPNFPSLDNSNLNNPTKQDNVYMPQLTSPEFHSSMNPLTPPSNNTHTSTTPEPSRISIEQIDKTIMPGVSAYDLMKPDRPPPTKEELLQLAAKHKIVMDKLKAETYTIDELCEALKKKATCSAVRGFLSAYLGEDFDKN